MKKKSLLLTVLAFTSISALVSCGGSGGPSNSDQVNFHTGYSDLVIASVKPDGNGKIDQPSINQTGYTIFGYYSDASYETSFDFSKPVGEVSDIYIKVLKGEGSESSPYLIESGLSLNSLTHLGEATSAYVEVTKDFEVLSHYTSDYANTEFNGTFNGKGHTVTLSLEGNDTGLFYKVGENGSLANLTVVGNIVGTHASTGAIANFNHGTIENMMTVGTEYHATNGCSNGVRLMTTFDAENPGVVLEDFGTLGHLATLDKGGAGAISGTNYGTIKNCRNQMRVAATIGGGSMAGINYGRIENCYNQGAIGASGNNAVNSTTIRDPEFSFSYIGGIAGANFGEIHQCANLNQVFVARLPWLYQDAPAGQDDFSDRIRVGGIAGYNYGEYDADSNTFTGGKITECINYGRVHGDMQVGGIAGYSNGYIADCFFSGLIGGRKSVGTIVGWQPGDKEVEGKIEFPGLVTNCASFSRVVAGSANTVRDENDNEFVTTQLTNKASGSNSNIVDYFKTAKYASNCVYHNNSGNINPIDYDAMISEAEDNNTSISSTAVMANKVYDKLSVKDGLDTGIWHNAGTESDATAMVGIASSWQVALHIRLTWQCKTITVKTDAGDVTIDGVAGVDYINTILVESSGKYTSDWNANLSGAIPGRGLPEVSHSDTQKVIWVTVEGDASTAWDGLLTEDITVYPMVVNK